MRGKISFSGLDLRRLLLILNSKVLYTQESRTDNEDRENKSLQSLT